MKLVYSSKPEYQYYVPSRWTLTSHEVKESVTPSKGDSVIVWNDARHIQQALNRATAEFTILCS